MFEKLFGKKPKEEGPVLPDKEELAARAAENGGGRAEFHTTDLSAEEERHREARAKDPWNTQMSGREAAVFNRVNHVDGGYAPIDYDPVKPEEKPKAEDDQKTA